MADGTVNVTVNADYSGIDKFADGIITALDQIQKSFGEVGDSFSDITEKLGPIGEAIAGALTVDAIKEFIESQLELGEKLENVSHQMGISTEQAGELNAIAGATGTSFDSLASDFERMQVSLAQNSAVTSRAQAGLKALGISAAEFKSQSPYEQMLQLANATSQFADGANKTAAIGAINRNMVQMIPLLDKGASGMQDLSAQLKSLGAIPTPALIEQLAQTEDDFNMLKAAAQGFSNAIMSSITPAIDAVINSLTDFLGDTTQAVQEMGILGGNMSFVSVAVRALATVFITLGSVAVSTFQDIAEGAADAGTAISFVAHAVADAWHGNFAQIKSDAADAWNTIAQREKDAANSSAFDQGTALIQKMWTQIGTSVDEAASKMKQAGQVSFGGSSDDAIKTTITNLNAEVAAYKAAEQQEQAAIQAKVKMKQEGESQASAQIIALLQQEKAQTDAVYAQEITAAQGNAEKIAEIKKQEQQNDAEITKQIQAQQIDAAEKAATAWQQSADKIESAFQAQVTGLLEGTETFGQAFQKVLLQLTVDIIDFFLRWAAEHAATVAMNIAGVNTETAATVAGLGVQTSAHAAANTAQAATGLAGMMQSLIQDAQRVFGGVFAFLAPTMGPAAAAPAAAASATVMAAHAQGAWELSNDHVAYVHQGEMIVPKAQTPWAQDLMSSAARAGAQGGKQSGGDTHYHLNPTINLPPGASGLSAKQLRDHGSTIVGILKDQMRLGAFRGYNPKV